MSRPDGFEIGDYFSDHDTELVVDFIKLYPKDWMDWLDAKYGASPEPESSYVHFLNDTESPQFKEFHRWAVSYIEQLLENDYPEADNTEEA